MIKIKAIAYSCLLLLTFIFTANAQKLPKIQVASVLAPASIKIDGKSTEWNNRFQAYNTSADIYYTVANDGENLYCIIQARRAETINKIVGGGITLTIQRSGEKDDRDGIGITYPVPDRPYRLSFNNLTTRKNEFPDNSTKTADSIMLKNNILLQEKCRFIVISGIKDMDTLSIYNEYGIKAVGLFDNKKIYTGELSVPLKYLGFSTNDKGKFSYHMRLNGFNDIPPPKVTISSSASPQVTALFEKLMTSANAGYAQLAAPIDFWGEYTLAKK